RPRRLRCGTAGDESLESVCHGFPTCAWRLVERRQRRRAILLKQKRGRADYGEELVGFFRRIKLNRQLRFIDVDDGFARAAFLKCCDVREIGADAVEELL